MSYKTSISTGTTSDSIIVCAENIAISHLLRNVPTPPSCNHAGYPAVFKGRSTLLFDTERKLAGTLAFIAHREDDAEHIPALYLEAEPESDGLKVILAVNKSGYNDGEDVIYRIQQGFAGIFAILATVSESTRYEDMGNQILTAVVSMCSPRILSRLRLTFSSRTATKRPLKDTLQEALFAVKIARRNLGNGALLETAGRFTMIAKEVGKLLETWSQYQVDTSLVKLVEGIHRLQQIVGLAELIRIIPNKDMSPSSRQSLLNIVNKVGRYWEAARFLYRTAKKFPLARTMRTVPVRLPKEAFSVPVIKEYAPDLPSKIIEAAPKGSQQKLLKEICATLKISQRDAIDNYSSQVLRTLRKAKIHAEIQLIAHCELQNPKVLPRVICSSKDACFLCNLCLQLYQKTYTPRSHGRLYPGWRLPLLPQLAKLQQRLSHALGDHFKETCTALLSTHRRSIYPDPNESTLLTLPLSRTTTRGSVLSEDANRAALLQGPSNVSIDDGRNEPRTGNTAHTEKRDLPSDSPSPSHHCTESTNTELESCTLAQSAKKCGLLAPGESSMAYRVGILPRLQIQIEHASGSNDLTFSLEWLSTEEAAEVRGKGSPPQLIDTNRLEGIVTLHEQNSMYLVAKDTILKVSWVSGKEGVSSSKPET